MESVLLRFDHNLNFWKANPQFKIMEPFKDLYKKDKSPAKVHSSNVMWAIALYKDPESILKNLPEEFKLERIKKEYTKVDLTDSKYEGLIQEFSFLISTQAERTLSIWVDAMHRRTKFIKECEYDIDNASKIDKILVETPKLYSELERIKEEIEKEGRASGTTRGGGEESSSDKGII